jgi:hypothetical protein
MYPIAVGWADDGIVLGSKEEGAPEVEAKTTTCIFVQVVVVAVDAVNPSGSNLVVVNVLGPKKDWAAKELPCIFEHAVMPVEDGKVLGPNDEGVVEGEVWTARVFEPVYTPKPCLA